MNKEEKIMLETNQSITKMETCFRNKIKELEQENKELHNKIDKAYEIVKKVSYELNINFDDVLEILEKDSDTDE